MYKLGSYGVMPVLIDKQLQREKEEKKEREREKRNRDKYCCLKYLLNMFVEYICI